MAGDVVGRVRIRKALSKEHVMFVIAAPARQVYEFALGWHLNRSQLLKLDYEWRRADKIHGSHDNVLGVQLVTSLDRISKAFH